MHISDVELPPLIPFLQDIVQCCTECGDCLESCAFLAHYGTPKTIVATFDFNLPAHQAIAYECSLCGLCTAVCPEQLDPMRLFFGNSESANDYLLHWLYRISQQGGANDSYCRSAIPA